MGRQPMHMIAIRTIDLSAKVRHRSGAGFPYKQPRARIKSHKSHLQKCSSAMNFPPG